MTTAVGLLGDAITGSGMARSLARAGLDVTVWNRTVGWRHRGLIADALRRCGTDDRLTIALHASFSDAAVKGHAADDMAAVAEVVGRTWPMRRMPRDAGLAAGTADIRAHVRGGWWICPTFWRMACCPEPSSEVEYDFAAAARLDRLVGGDVVEAEVLRGQRGEGAMARTGRCCAS